MSLAEAIGFIGIGAAIGAIMVSIACISGRRSRKRF